MPQPTIVAQICNLLYRGFPIRNRPDGRTSCRIQFGDTADCKSALRWIRLIAACALLLFSPAVARAALLYSTDFSSFPVGDDQLVGHDGWNGNSIGEHVHGIDTNLVPSLGNSA